MGTDFFKHAIFAACIFTGLCISMAWAQSDSVPFTEQERAYLERKGHITIVVDPYWMPIEELDEKGNHRGIAADFLDVIRERGNLDIRVIPVETWSEAYKMATTRKADMTSLLAQTPDRSHFLNFSDPLFEVQSVIATLEYRPTINDIAEIKHQPIGVIRDYSHIETLRREMPEINLVYISDYDEGLVKIQSGDLYGVIGNMATISYSVLKLRITNIKIAGRFGEPVNLHFGLRNDEPELQSIMNKVISTITDEEKNEIINNWLSIHYDQRPDYKLLMQVSGAFLFLVLITLFWIMKQRKLNQQLKSLNNKLKNVNIQKDYFFSVIGHDLRTPLTNVIGYSSIIEEEADKLDPETIAKFAQTVKSNTKQIMETLNQLLEWSKVEVHQEQLMGESVNLHKITIRIFNLYEDTAESKGIQLNNHLPPELILQIDSHMISAIIRNLVNNAIKFSNSGDEITVSFKKTSDKKDQLLVADTGVGLTDSQLENLFKFEINQSTRGTANEQGTGLGLIICKKYADLLGAELRVERNKEKGTVFILTLPGKSA